VFDETDPVEEHILEGDMINDRYGPADNGNALQEASKRGALVSPIPKETNTLGKALARRIVGSELATIDLLVRS